MSPAYTIGRIPADKIDQALPLARMAFPGLGVEEWRRRCMPSSDDAGIWAAIAPAGHIRGLCRVLAAAPGVPASLEVDGVVIASVADPGAVASAMLYRLALLCEERRCGRLVLSVPAPFPEMLLVIARARDRILAAGARLAIVLLAE